MLSEEYDPTHQAADRQLPAGVLAPRPDRLGVTPVRVATRRPWRPAPTRRASMSTDHYDVIIIGTGAGGGTLAHTLAAAGKEDPPARTRQLPAAGDGELGPGRGVHRRPVHLRGDLVRRRRHRVPAAGALLRRGRDEAVRRRAVPAAAAGLRRAAPRRRTVAGVAGGLRRLRAVLHEGRMALPGPRHARRGPDRGSLEQAVPVARGLARAAHPADGRGPGRRRLPPVLGAVRDPARRGRPGEERVHPMHLV